MIKPGKIYTLKMLRKSTSGIVLDGKNLGKIFLAENELSLPVTKGDTFEVFIFADTQKRLIATTRKPKILINQIALLPVVAKSSKGVYLDWGLHTDLFVPFSEQKKRMQIGNSYLVYTFWDASSNRIIASAKLDSFLDQEPVSYREGQEVALIISDQTDLGFKAIINQSHWGVLYKNELFRELTYGQKIQGYIKKIRPDNKIDLTLEQPGLQKIDTLCNDILALLRKHKGFMAISDRSSPELIKQTFGTSKKNFKKALGALYKRKQIIFADDGIKLLKESRE